MIRYCVRGVSRLSNASSITGARLRRRDRPLPIITTAAETGRVLIV